MADSFTCRTCGASFSVPEAALRKYPGWTPSQCLRCRGGGRGRAGASSSPRRATTPSQTPEEALQRHSAGPRDGVFTDGACSGNPGPGGWAAVWVAGDEIVAERHGSEPQTTNNRMELTALINAYRLLPEDAELTMWSDSQLCVRTLTEWAAGWQARGWRRKAGPIKNLELVQEAYALARSHPAVQLRWIKAHDGSRWNEYVDALATSQMKKQG